MLVSVAASHAQSSVFERPSLTVLRTWVRKSVDVHGPPVAV